MALCLICFALMLNSCSIINKNKELDYFSITISKTANYDREVIKKMNRYYGDILDYVYDYTIKIQLKEEGKFKVDGKIVFNKITIAYLISLPSGNYISRKFSNNNKFEIVLSDNGYAEIALRDIKGLDGKKIFSEDDDKVVLGYGTLYEELYDKYYIDEIDVSFVGTVRKKEKNIYEY